MRKKFDNILLGILWWSAATLGVSFWFNSRFGFNIFSNAHWKHLAYMQASQNPVAPAFYTSVIVSVIVVILGGYLILKPRKAKNIATPPHAPTPTVTSGAGPTLPAASDAPQPTPAPAYPATSQPAAAPKIPEENLSRPSRIISQSAPGASVIPVAPIPGAAPQTPPTAPYSPAPIFTPTIPDVNNADLSAIFTDAGYTVKHSPRIKGVQTNLLAIGTNETVWIGATGMPTSKLQTAIDELNQVFMDTLEDIEIHVHAFIVNAPDALTPASNEILIFDSVETLGNYMREHRNPPLDADSTENFQAFSGYISTVIEYIEKL